MIAKTSVGNDWRDNQMIDLDRLTQPWEWEKVEEKRRLEVVVVVQEEVEEVEAVVEIVVEVVVVVVGEVVEAVVAA